MEERDPVAFGPPRLPQQEAADRLGGRWQVRVLEPSPPADDRSPFFAADPVSGGDVVPLDRPGSRSWDSVLADQGDEELTQWAAERWLGKWRRLEPLPVTFPQTRRSLQAVAEHILCAARCAANGKIGLRYTFRGFGTPYFGAGRQLRVEAGRLIDTDEVREHRAAITTLRDAGVVAGLAPGAPVDLFTPATPLDLDAPLTVDEPSALALGDWYGFCASVLEQTRADAGANAGRVQLWPEHFDMAVDAGDESRAARANFGGSPGDDAHPSPYLDVGPWAMAELRPDPFWNEPFGASLSYADVLAAGDQRAAALEFFARARELLG
jgi:hypothetical protein